MSLFLEYTILRIIFQSFIFGLCGQASDVIHIELDDETQPLGSEEEDLFRSEDEDDGQVRDPVDNKSPRDRSGGDGDGPMGSADDLEWVDVDLFDGRPAVSVDGDKNRPAGWKERVAARQQCWSTSHGFRFGRKLGDWEGPKETSASPLASNQDTSGGQVQARAIAASAKAPRPAGLLAIALPGAPRPDLAAGKLLNHPKGATTWVSGGSASKDASSHLTTSQAGNIASLFDDDNVDEDEGNTELQEAITRSLVETNAAVDSTAATGGKSAEIAPAALGTSSFPIAQRGVGPEGGIPHAHDLTSDSDELQWEEINDSGISRDAGKSSSSSAAALINSINKRSQMLLDLPSVQVASPSPSMPEPVPMMTERGQSLGSDRRAPGQQRCTDVGERKLLSALMPPPPNRISTGASRASGPSAAQSAPNDALLVAHSSQSDSRRLNVIPDGISGDCFGFMTSTMPRRTQPILSAARGECSDQETAEAPEQAAPTSRGLAGKPVTEQHSSFRIGHSSQEDPASITTNSSSSGNLPEDVGADEEDSMDWEECPIPDLVSRPITGRHVQNVAVDNAGDPSGGPTGIGHHTADASRQLPSKVMSSNKSMVSPVSSAKPSLPQPVAHRLPVWVRAEDLPPPLQPSDEDEDLDHAAFQAAASGKDSENWDEDDFREEFPPVVPEVLATSLPRSLPLLAGRNIAGDASGNAFDNASAAVADLAADEPLMDIDVELAAVDAESEALRQDRYRAARSADAPTAEMYAECQELLQIFGLPFIVAPVEVRSRAF